MYLLFVCSKNKWRSRTAETIFKHLPMHQVKSAGTDQGARIKLTESMLRWADMVFVMEDKHRDIIWRRFKSKAFDDKIVVLDIPDEYQYMDEELILSLETAVSPYIKSQFFNE
jgi:protein-tyrosine phosphatase